MSAPFRFKHFTVRQDNAPMKVGTDGVLLGSWACGGEKILDIGTGTGLIALMMAQRYKNAQVTGIDINNDAIRDALENVANSPFAERVAIERCALQEFDDYGFDTVVCNPPFFVRSLQCPDGGRTEARHAETLNICELMKNSYDILNEGGRLSVILPYEQEKTLIDQGREAGFAVSRLMRVRPTENAPYKRVMVELVKGKNTKPITEQEMFIEKARHVYSDAYHNLTKDFYLDKN